MFTHSFYTHRSQKWKMTDGLTAFFALLGSMRIRAARKMLVKSIPGLHFIRPEVQIFQFIFVRSVANTVFALL